MSHELMKEKKTRQTAVKYSPGFEARLEKALHSRRIPRSTIFMDMVELAVEFSEKTELRLEDVPAKLRELCFNLPKGIPAGGQKPGEPETRSTMGSVNRTMSPPKGPPVPLNVANASDGVALSNGLDVFLSKGASQEEPNAQA